MHVHPAARFDTRRRRLLVAILAVAAACGPATGSAEVQTIATDAGSGKCLDWTCRDAIHADALRTQICS